jgi:hypothetical protein
MAKTVPVAPVIPTTILFGRCDPAVGAALSKPLLPPASPSGVVDKLLGGLEDELLVRRVGLEGHEDRR